MTISFQVHLKKKNNFFFFFFKSVHKLAEFTYLHKTLCLLSHIGFCCHHFHRLFLSFFPHTFVSLLPGGSDILPTPFTFLLYSLGAIKPTSPDIHRVWAFHTCLPKTASSSSYTRQQSCPVRALCRNTWDAHTTDLMWSTSLSHPSGTPAVPGSSDTSHRGFVCAVCLTSTIAPCRFLFP